MSLRLNPSGGNQRVTELLCRAGCTWSEVCMACPSSHPGGNGTLSVCCPSTCPESLETQRHASRLVQLGSAKNSGASYITATGKSKFTHQRISIFGIGITPDDVDIQVFATDRWYKLSKGRWVLTGAPPRQSWSYCAVRSSQQRRGSSNNDKLVAMYR